MHPVLRKLLEACFLGAFSIIALIIPLLNIPLMLVAAPLFYLPWAREFFGFGPGLNFLDTWTGIAVFFVYFSAFWGWVDWYRARRRAARLAKRPAAGEEPEPQDEDLLTLLIVAVLPILLLAVLLLPLGWVVILIAIGFAGNASYRGMRAFKLPWGGVFFLLGALYAVTVIFVIVGLIRSL